MGSDPTMAADLSAQGRTSSALHPLVLLLLYGVSAGAAFSVTKIAIVAGVRPLGFATWQFIGAALVMTVFGFLRGDLPALSRRHLVFYAVCGGPCLALPLTGMFVVLEHLPAGIVGLIIATLPIITYALALIVGLERVRWLRAAGIACGVVGAALILLPNSAPAMHGSAGWVLLAFVSPIMYAFGNLYVGTRRPADISALALTVGMLVVAAAVMVPVSLLSGQFYLPRFADPGRGEFMIAIQIVLASLNYLMFFEIIRRAGPVYFSQIGYIVTLSAMLWAVVLFGERYSIWVMGATALVFAGIALTNAKPRRSVVDRDAGGGLGREK